jgi:hypothetical protein
MNKNAAFRGFENKSKVKNKSKVENKEQSNVPKLILMKFMKVQVELVPNVVSDVISTNIAILAPQTVTELTNINIVVPFQSIHYISG